MFPELPARAAGMDLAARIEIVAAALATACEQAFDGVQATAPRDGRRRRRVTWVTLDAACCAPRTILNRRRAMLTAFGIT